MNDIDILRPEVREAWQRIVADEQHPEDFECVEAELLRLADDCARLESGVGAVAPPRAREGGGLT